MPLTKQADINHTKWEDAQGLTLGIILASLGVHILTAAGLFTGQTAGIAVIISYLTGWSFGLVFSIINVPFYFLAYSRLGLEFTLKSIASVSALSSITELLPSGLPITNPQPLFAAIAFGACVGLGLLASFRHNGSLGGLSVVALLIQDNTGFKAGYVQLIADTVIFATAAFLFPLPIVGWSLLGAVILNNVIAINHRRDRYIAT
jgi:uncharacterized membrane-anchored protein YitT (DUF2179 family)